MKVKVEGQHCKFCDVICNSSKQFQENRSSSKHQLNVNTAREQTDHNPPSEKKHQTLESHSKRAQRPATETIRVPTNPIASSGRFQALRSISSEDNPLGTNSNAQVEDLVRTPDTVEEEPGEGWTTVSHPTKTNGAGSKQPTKTNGAGSKQPTKTNGAGSKQPTKTNGAGSKQQTKTNGAGSKQVIN